MFANLPDLVLEDVFSRLTIAHRYNASMVCTNWNRIFHSPRIWSTFHMKDRILTRRKFNYYLGYEHTLDHFRTQIFLHQVGNNLRKIIIHPMTNFFNLYEFMTMLSSFAEYFDENPLRFVHTLHFSFACHIKKSTESSDEQVFGTGGRLLATLRKLLGNLVGLRTLVLSNLLLSEQEANDLMDFISLHSCDTLTHLRLVNYSKDLCPFLHVTSLLRLTELTLSPQQLSEDVVELLVLSSLKHLYIVQNTYTEVAVSVPADSWHTCRKLKKFLNVHLRLEGPLRKEIIWQEKAPVRSIVYDSRYSQVTAESILTVVDLYANDLQMFAHLSLPRFCMRRSFHDRADSSLVLLCRQCPNLTTLVIRQLISTATVLLVAWTGKRLKRLYIRRNAIIKRADWPKSPDWSTEFYVWLKNTARDYDLVQREVSRMLDLPWKPLNDFEFKTLELDYHSTR